MVTSVNLSIDLRRMKQDGTYPLILRLGHKQCTTTIPLNISICEKDWDTKKRVIKGSYKGTDSLARLNNELRKRRQDAWDIVMDLHAEGVLNSMSVAELRAKIDADPNMAISIFTFANDQIDELKKAHKFGTARSYKGVISIVKKFNNNKDLQFQEITYRFLTKFETWHFSKGNGVNGLSVYVRAIRAIYNKAIKTGLVPKELYPFTDYKIKSSPTEKRALDAIFIRKIINLELSPDDSSFNARNYFLASYMMYGMNFADMAYLKPEDIKNGLIQYRRRKTSKLYDIRIAASLQNIFDHYLNKLQYSEFIFPILKRQGQAFQDKDIQWHANTITNG